VRAPLAAIAVGLLLAAVCVVLATSPAQGRSVATASGAPTFRGDRISDFDLVQAARGAITEVPDPAGGDRRVFGMTVGDGDVYPITPTENPRAALLSPPNLQPGNEFWWRAEVFLPRNFPARVPDWLTLLEGPYGPPFYGTPSFHIEVTHDRIQWGRNSTYDWDVPWQMPLVRGRWIHFLMHIDFAEHGFVEMWVDGKRVTFFGGHSYNPNHIQPTPRLGMSVLDHSNDGAGNFVAVMSYRKVGMFPSVTLYQGPTEFGPTFASLGP